MADQKMNHRWVLVCEDRHGLTSLMLPCQGRYTYATKTEAQDLLSSILSANSNDTLTKTYGPKMVETATVMLVACWPGHNDPIASIY